MLAHLKTDFRHDTIIDIAVFTESVLVVMISTFWIWKLRCAIQKFEDFWVLFMNDVFCITNRVAAMYSECNLNAKCIQSSHGGNVDTVYQLNIDVTISALSENYNESWALSDPWQSSSALEVWSFFLQKFPSSHSRVLVPAVLPMQIQDNSNKHQT